VRALTPLLLLVAFGCKGDSDAGAGKSTTDGPGTTTATPKPTTQPGETQSDPCEGAPAGTAAMSSATPYSTIQAAVDAAGAGTTAIAVCAGTWSEDLVVGGEGELRLTGAGIDASTIQGTGAGPVLTVRTTAPIILDGLTLTGGVGEYGGGIDAREAVDLQLTRVRLSGNRAQFGGGLLIGAGGATLTEVELSGNTADDYGGGLAIDLDGVATLSHTLIDGNTALYGGGAFGFPGAELHGSDTAVQDNTATTGGGIYLWEGALSGVTLSGNSAATTGGGLYMLNGGALSQVTVTGNTAQQGAGVAAVDDAEALPNTWSDVVVSDNDAIAAATTGPSAYGGGVYLVDSAVIADDTVEVSANRSEFGGGLFLRDATWSGGTITGNDADEGGGIYVSSSDSSSVVGGVLIEGNTATVSGAGVSSRSAASTVTNAVVTGNASGDRAGGVYAAGLGTLDLVDCEVSANTAVERGGGLYLHNDVRLTADGLVLADNHALRGAGAYVNAAGASLVMRGGELLRNGDTDTVSGGGVRIQIGSYEAAIVDFGQFLDANAPDDIYLGDSFESVTDLGPGVSIACDVSACR
jgi:hypothetical protein